MPYVFGEFAALTPGHRFDENARTSSRLLGLGFRFIIGNVDKAGFLADLSLAQRTITIDSGGQQFKMSAPEIFRLALGAEIRLSNIFTLSPVAHLSGGSMEQSDGTVSYAQGRGGTAKPPRPSKSAPSPPRSAPISASASAAASEPHFDLFGK